jgi:hypothetical protein
MARHYLVVRHPRRNVIRCACGRISDRVGRPGQSIPSTTCRECRDRTLAWRQAEAAGQLRLPGVIRGKE